MEKEDLREEELESQEEIEEEEEEEEVDDDDDDEGEEWDLGYDDDDDEEEEEEWVPYVEQLKEGFKAARRHGFRRSGQAWIALSLAMVADSIMTAADTVCSTFTDSLGDLLESFEIRTDTQTFTTKILEQKLQEVLVSLDELKKRG